jgi:hypothetical protein
LGDLLKIILPNITVQLNFEIVKKYPEQKLSSSNRTIKLEVEPLTELNESTDIKLLTRFLVHDSLIFDLSQISNFDFDLHFDFYTQLSAQFPQVATKLF